MTPTDNHIILDLLRKQNQLLEELVKHQATTPAAHLTVLQSAPYGSGRQTMKQYLRDDFKKAFAKKWKL